MKKKLIIGIIAAVLLLSCTVGATLAWLIDETETVTNTFTYGDINITLDESENLDLKMIPGKTITKDPVVTVKGGSEACWLFVKIEKSANFDSFMTYATAEGWTALDEVDGVYYREVTSSADDQAFPVIAGNQVTVSEEVTKEALTALTPETAPTLSFTAYAVQKDGIDTAADAWAKIG